MRNQLEICCTNFESCHTAQIGGADRIELCANLYEGGTTPSFGLIGKVLSTVEIKVFVLIRPRGGDFTYSDEEFEIMQMDIRQARKMGVDGIVSGLLTPNGQVDVSRTQKLVKLCRNMEFTFHRAFDLISNPEEALNDVVKSGASRLLTSGQKPNVIAGAARLENLVSEAGTRIAIVAGGGVSSSNLQELMHKSSCTEYHSSAKTSYSPSVKYSDGVKMNMLKEIPENQHIIASLAEVKSLRKILDEAI